jgi:Ca2+-binding EF-hand superfamily protein
MIYGINSSNSLMGQLNMTSARPKPEEMFAKMDANGDGSVDKAEMQSFSEEIANQDGDTIDITKMFADIDTDSDGKISQDEFLAAKPPEMKEGQGPGQPPDPEEMFSKMDVNGDGSIDKDEMKAFMEKMPAHDGKSPDVDKMFSENDANGDGKITKKEFVTAETNRQTQMQAMMSQASSVEDSSDDNTSYLLKTLEESNSNLMLNQVALYQYSNLYSSSLSSNVNLLT